ncbi:MAG: hypothetical protein ACRECX_07335 [Methyloceanibacter sp.]|uniref:hypothetical protein n=1 Tax=Methyloceanibacter sp. TaxID=1965321 RepID=UPI003D6D3CD0
MNIKMLPFSVGCFALALGAGFAVPSNAAPGPHEAASKACAIAGGAPATPVAAVDDGRGGSLVWLSDVDANLWLCSADGQGHVYAYAMIFHDLLEGAGTALVEPVYLDDDGKPIPSQDPLEMAELACKAYFSGEGGKVVGRGEDGLNADWLPGYFVFIETKAGETFLCDATPNAQVWAFAKIGKPINLGNPVG